MPNSAIKLQPATEPPSPPASLGELLCSDTSCSKRCAPTVAQIAELLSGDNELSRAIDERITSALRQYAGERFAAQAARIDSIDAKLDASAAATTRVEASTAGIVELMNSWAGAMKTIEMTGKVLKPLTWIVGFISALVGLWATLRTGGK
jgi:hypothetical protein